MIRSRRKQERNRVQVRALQKQYNDLKEQQIELLREGRELEELLQEAEAKVGEKQQQL